MDTETDYTLVPFEKRGELIKKFAAKIGVTFTARLVVSESGIFALPGISDLWEKKDVESAP